MEKHARFSWAAKIMNIKSNDYLLEIGCGVGMAIEEIAPLLKQGKIIGIDRSDKMIKTAEQRNGRYIDEGNVELLKTDLLHLPIRQQQFNKVFCFNINLFWTQKSVEKEVAMIKSVLKKNGSLFIFYGPMVASGLGKIKEPMIQNLKKEKIKVEQDFYDKALNCCGFKCAI
ncbi:class I SAM-dependent methyltransferase [Chryseolinea sp. H1M3-3]|uniref:class I SAM-dependent methyltransferase n=1 Tax=Chryseolinea sp. H1M3-3 TaxID=3034144 RepID=UPI0023ECF344|nr:class I SAM-dependent methyltransferase [Chryseolinea sp. H1M3-3]